MPYSDGRPTKNPLSPSALWSSLPRAVDQRPIWAQLNITWRCNLDCAYCTEYDNQKDHVPYDVLLGRIDKCRELGVLHTDLIGGEPLLHPDLVRLFQHVSARGMTSGMTTNGFLLTKDKLDQLLDAGLGRLQISVDGVRPTRQAPKSLKTLQAKIELCAGRPIWFRVNTVICEETLDQVEEVARFCFAYSSRRLEAPDNEATESNRVVAGDRPHDRSEEDRHVLRTAPPDGQEEKASRSRRPWLP